MKSCTVSWVLGFVLLVCITMETWALGFSNVGVEMNRIRKTRLVGQADYDDQREDILFKVKVTNTDLSKPLDSAKVKVWVFGESTTMKGRLKVFSIDEQSLSLQAGKSIEFETTNFENVYDDNAVAKFGEKYSGWVILVYDSSGAIIYQKSSTERYLKNLNKLDGLQVRSYCDRDYNPKQNPDLISR